MKTQSPDTSPKMEKVYFDILRAQTPAQRLRGVRELTASAIHRERQWLASRNPEWSEEEIKLQWARLAYGEAIALQLRTALQLRAKANG